MPGHTRPDAHELVLKKRKAKRKKRKALTYCQRLVMRIDDADSKRLKTSTVKTYGRTTFLSLPPEIRQMILYNMLDDDDIPVAMLVEECMRIYRVCRHLQEDARWVLRQWQKRAKELADKQILQRGALESYMADLLGPIRSASDRLHQQNRVHQTGGKLRRKQQRNEAKLMYTKQISLARAEELERQGGYRDRGA